MPGHNSIARINRRFLANLNILRLGLRDFDLRFQFRRVCHARQIISDLHPLPHVHRHLLQDAIHAGLYVQGFHLIEFQLRGCFHLIYFSLLRRQLWFDGFARKIQALLFNRVPV